MYVYNDLKWTIVVRSFLTWAPTEISLDGSVGWAGTACAVKILARPIFVKLS